MKTVSLGFAMLAMGALLGGCATQQQMARTVTHEPVLLEEECRVIDGVEVCRPAETLTPSGRIASVARATHPRIPSEIGAAVGKADAARRLAAAEIIAACLDNGGRPEACAKAAVPYSGVAGAAASYEAIGPAPQQQYQGQIQPYRGQQQPRGCQSTWPMFPSLC